jgi:hypothetical protein
MGFFDKIFSGKAGGSDSKSAELMKGWKNHENTAGGFFFSYPPAWTIGETDQGLELYPSDASRVTDPILAREVADRRVIVLTGDIADHSQNILKDVIRQRSVEYQGYKFVKHHSNSIPKAVHGVIYEFQYGPQDRPFSALSAIAQSKNRFVEMTAFGTAEGFDRNRDVIEAIVFSFRVS